MSGNTSSTRNRPRSVEHLLWSALEDFGGTSLRPREVTPLKVRKKIQVYRVVCGDCGSPPIIVKHVLREVGTVEAFIYQSILPQADVPSLKVLGISRDRQNDKFAWLFLEDAGEVRYVPTELSHRRLAGEWLGRLHATEFASQSVQCIPSLWPKAFFERIESLNTLLETMKNHDGCRSEKSLLAGFIQFFWSVLQLQGDLERLAASFPQTLVHADFVAKNLRIRTSETGEATLLVFDWDQSGLGPGPLDLVHPPEKQCSRLVKPDLRAYCRALGPSAAKVELPRIRNFLPVAVLFRIVNAIAWAAWMVDASLHEKFLSQLRVYRPWLLALDRELVTALDRGSSS